MLPAKFREARRYLGLSARRFAAMIEVSERQVRRWEKEEAPLIKTAVIILTMMVLSPEVRKFVGMTKREMDWVETKPRFDLNSPAPVPKPKRKRNRT